MSAERTLHDGTVVDSDSEAWRHQCEAVAVARLPTLEMRRTYLEDVTRIRGKAAGDRLRATVRAVWGAESRSDLTQ